MHRGPKKVELENMHALEAALPIRPVISYTQLAWRMSRQLKRPVTKGQVAKAYYKRKHQDGQASYLGRVQQTNSPKP